MIIKSSFCVIIVSNKSKQKTGSCNFFFQSFFFSCEIIVIWFVTKIAPKIQNKFSGYHFIMYYELQPSKGCSLYEPYVSCREKKTLHRNGLERLEGASSSVFKIKWHLLNMTRITLMLCYILSWASPRNYHF